MTGLQYDQLFKIIDVDESGAMIPSEIPGLVKAYETWLYEKSYQQSMEELYSEGVNKDDDDHAIDVKVAWVKTALTVMTGPQYELFMNVVTIINVFSVFVRSFMQNANSITVRGWMIA